MMDRFNGDTVELNLDQRVGFKFISSSYALFDALTHVSSPRHLNLKEKLSTLRSAIDRAGDMWLELEQTRPPFTIPAGLRHDYEFAKKRFLFTKANPHNFYEKNLKEREEMEKERKMIAVKIAEKEVLLARAEDDRRHEIESQRDRINNELAILNARRQRYEKLIAKKTVSLLSSCLGSYQDRLSVIIDDINHREDVLKNLGKQISPELEDMAYQLNLLRKRRFEVGKTLNVRNDHHPIHVAGWQNAVDIAETVMLVRGMDIESAANRYYCSEPIDITHAFLSVYGLIKDILAQRGLEMTNDMRQQLSLLDGYAGELHAPSVAGRSIDTLYKKMLMLKDEDRNQVIYRKPEKNQLPEALLRTLSVKAFQKNGASLGLFRKILPVTENASSQLSAKVQIK